MPAKSERMANFMRMALAVKHGHKIEGMGTETMDALHKAARSMTDKQIRDFSHVAKRSSAKKK
jgi:hypothetical protein